MDRPTGQLTLVLMLRASVPVALRAQTAAAGLAPDGADGGTPAGGGAGRGPAAAGLAQATIDRERRPEVLAGLRPVRSLTVLRALKSYSHHQHLVDLFVTNVPGPQLPLFVVLARLLEAFPWCRWPVTSR